MATHPYEQLNGESFQQLCQSLLVRAYPELQCFPVGQPDGGRDAIARLSSAKSTAREFILFQVKFSKRQRTDTDARDWLTATLKTELPKVEKQIGEGARKFILITNVPGSAHARSGSIDKLQALLDEHIPIEAEAWWRDDLDRRLDDAWDLKFAYPALFTGTDFLRLAIEASPSEGRERRQQAITAFLSTQFNSEREVKFKQAELQNDIFKLFTDVPLMPRIPAERTHGIDEALSTAFRRGVSSTSSEVDSVAMRQWLDTALGIESNLDSHYPRDEAWLGAAALLLDRDFQRAQPLVVLEGAPGQGKSTIAQFICQVHRQRLLNHRAQGDPNPYGSDISLRLPFKVELRDFATWISGGSPFGDATSLDSPSTASQSLEGFLAALVQFASGGSDFSVSDLQLTLNATPGLVVLDGLDEVADTKQRKQVVEQIESAVSRFTSLDSPIQVVVTSRPTPFVNAAVLPRRFFATYSLGSLARPLIKEYAERWLKSREIGESDANDVRRILNRQVDEPHLRDLARNPMQLAILLNLIHRRGVSLPDKRTALYDDYVQLFFDRESEKAPIVKENRELLIRIHRYLAWVLQSDAEVVSQSGSRSRRISAPATSRSGTITETDLKQLVSDFLEKEGSNTSLVDDLFDGMVERVVAIVSRVQGSYEFDVQTLREYFAARYLYETAPYSPAGNQRPGTISDRWNALSRNYYWLNVARFYAGCYSEGELPSLIDDLRNLCDDEVFGHTSHPQLLASTLLGDWVFSQRPGSSRDAVDLLLEPRGLRLLLASSASGFHQAHDVIIRDPIGRERLLTACKELVTPGQPIDHVLGLIRSILRPNVEPQELYSWWVEQLRSASESQAVHWCWFGEYARCWSVIDYATVTELLDRETVPSSNVIAGLLDANRMDILEESEQLFEAGVQTVLDGTVVRRFRVESILDELAWTVDPMLLQPLSLSRTFGTSISLEEYQSGFRPETDGPDSITLPDFDAAGRCARLVQAYASAAKRPLVEWHTSIEPWNEFVQQGIAEFGEHRKFVELANIAAGIRSTEQKCADSPDLFDSNQPLVRRARYARLRAGVKEWWDLQLSSTSDVDQEWMALLLFVTWAGSRTVESLIQTLDGRVANLAPSAWHGLYSSLQNTVNINSDRSWVKTLGLRTDALPPSLHPRTALLLAARCTRGTADEVNERYLNEYAGDDSIAMSLRADLHVRRALADRTKWPHAVESLRLAYSLGGSISGFPYQHLGSRLPADVARKVVDDPLAFPATIVRAAENRCRRLDASRVLPVGDAAAEEEWFAN